jgi:hypothetical protein
MSENPEKKTFKSRIYSPLQGTFAIGHFVSVPQIQKAE